MKTILFEINENNIDNSKIREISEILKSGGIVAFPTETVYGLGANAYNKESIKKVFEVKGRPIDNPLIVHISNLEQLKELVIDIPKDAEKLIDKFWPGPITIIFKKKECVPSEVSAGLDTIAVRFPSNKIAQAIIKAVGPIAAPSANSSGKPSGTRARDVLEDLDGKIEGIVVCDSCNIGIESTVFSTFTNEILRPGKISLEEIKEIIPSAKIHENKSEKIISPGMKYKHYAPMARIILFDSAEELDKLKKDNVDKKIEVIYEKDKDKLSEELFFRFREADRQGIELILINRTNEEGIGRALVDRINRAIGK